MLEAYRLDSVRRINEVRATLDVIKHMESQDPLVPDSKEVLILRGLYYVHLYGAFEYSINQGVQAVLGFITSSKVQVNHIEHILNSVVLDSQFNSYKDSGVDVKWEKRISLLSEIQSDGECRINDAVFSYYLQNIWYKSLEQVFKCLCIPDRCVPENRLIGYIDEIVNKRNSVAHGRESAADVGAGTRSPDLQIRFDAIVQVINHIYDCFENYLLGKHFISEIHRISYAE